MKSIVTFTVITAVTLFSTVCAAESVKASFNKGTLTLGTESKRFSLKLSGRIMYDAGFVNSDEENFVAENNFRRARLALKTKLNDTWASKFDLEFSNSEANLRDLWISYIGLNNFTFTIGNQKPHFSLDELTSSRWTTFMERSMVSDISISGRRIGLSGSYTNERFVVGATIFGDSVDISNSDAEFENEDGDDIEGISEKYSYSVRALYRPYINNDSSKLFHIGFNYLNLKPESDENTRIRLATGVESSLITPTPLDTGNIENVEERISQGIEIAGKYNKFSIKGEYIKSTINRSGGEADIDTDGYYLETAYSIWGAGKSYKKSSGVFGGIFPQTKKGDLEVALRYSTLDLNDANANIFGGSADNVTFALNWYPNNNALIKLNYIISSLDENATGRRGEFITDDDVSITAIRFQLTF